MKRVYLSILIILSLLVSCSIQQGEPIKLYFKSDNGLALRQCSFPILYVINSEVPKKTRGLIIESFNYFDNLTNKKLFFYMGLTNLNPNNKLNNGLVVVGLTTEKRTHINKNILGYAKILSYWEKSGCINKVNIFIFKDIINNQDNKIKTIIRHEIGHVLGFNHSVKPDDLMYKISQDYLFRTNLKELSEWEIKAFNIYYK